MKQPFHFLPYLVLLLTVINTTVQYKTNLRLYLFLGVLAIGISGIRFLSSPFKERLKSGAILLLALFAWVGLVFLIQYASNGLYKDTALAFKRIFSLIWAPLFWIFFVPCADNFNWKRFVHFQIAVALLIVLLGFIQRFYSMNLFGFIPDVKWQQHFVYHRDTYRVTSLLSSPQVYGLYCAIMAAIAVSVSSELPKKLLWMAGAFLAVGGALSGNKSVTLLLILFVIAKAKLQYKIVTGPLIFGLALILLAAGDLTFQPSEFGKGGNYSSSMVRSTMWIFNIADIYEHESRGRISIYSSVLTDADTLIGEGLGCTASDEGVRGINTESHVLLLLVELGLPGMVLFILAFIFFYVDARQTNDHCRRYCILLAGVSCVIVHAITYPVFFGIWGIIVGCSGGAHPGNQLSQQR